MAFAGKQIDAKGEITLDKYCPACVKIQSVTGWDFENTDEEEE
jgi:hypothetical protein